MHAFYMDYYFPHRANLRTADLVDANLPTDGLDGLHETCQDILNKHPNHNIIPYIKHMLVKIPSINRAWEID